VRPRPPAPPAPLSPEDRLHILRPVVLSLRACGYTNEQIVEFVRTRLDPRPTLDEVQAITDEFVIAVPDWY
jgi:hypothetical protein